MGDPLDPSVDDSSVDEPAAATPAADDSLSERSFFDDAFAKELLEGELELLSDAIADELSFDEVSATPTTRSRSALWAAIESTHRFEGLAEPLAELSDIDLAAADALLLAIDDPQRWEAGLVPWIHLIDFDGGPKTERSITGLVRIDPGQSFPEHGHLGPEAALILQGECRDTQSGQVCKRGDVVRRGTEVQHGVVVTSEIPLIYLAVVAEGIMVGDLEIRFDDPRG